MHLIPILLGGFMVLITACGGQRPLLVLENLEGPVAEGEIWDTTHDEAISFEQMIGRLGNARVVYVGERHNSSPHHDAQLRIIQALAEKGWAVQVGMEMFDHTYQDKLDRWTDGAYDWASFLNETHWYANWRYDDALYRNILIYVKENGLRVVGLNIPFWLPPKIATGGLDSLSPEERDLLPDIIDTSIEAHRAYVEKIYKMHRLKGRDNFEYFYQAQCAWEDGMAQTIADNLNNGPMVVLAGNGHIQRKFGIPDRAFQRTSAAFQTIFLASPGDTVSASTADFIWILATPHKPGHP
jgi:uncharacterized iron-regulated protein